MEIEIPGVFVVRKCERCNRNHAPIRDHDCLSNSINGASDTVEELEEYDREADYWFWSGSGQ